MIGNFLKIEQFKQWIEHFSEFDEVKPTVIKRKDSKFTYFELYRGNNARPFVQSKHYNNDYIDRMERAGKLFEYK